MTIFSRKLSCNFMLKSCSLSCINCFLNYNTRFSSRCMEGIDPSFSSRLLGLSVMVLPQQRWLSSRYLQINQAENSASERGRIPVASNNDKFPGGDKLSEFKMSWKCGEDINSLLYIVTLRTLKIMI